MIALLAFAAGVTLVGRAILRRARLVSDEEIAWLIAPSIGLAAAALALGVAVALGVPVRLAAAPFWCGVAAASVYAVWRAPRMTGAAAAGLVAAGYFALSLLSADVRRGLTEFVGSPGGDGWSYVAFANYLWEVPKGTAGSLPPLQQYASHLASTRHVSSALLAVISPLANGGGDTQSAVGPLLAALLFVFGAAAMAIGRLVGLAGWRAILVGLLAVWSPWVLDAIQMHNYDNLIALSFAPAIVTVLRSDGPPRRLGILAALLLAGAVYAYVELSVISGLALAFTGIRRVIGDRGRGWRSAAIVGGLVFGVCLAPIALPVVSFLSDQVHVVSGAVGVRPGEGYLPELIQLSAWPRAYWHLIGQVGALGFGAFITVAAWMSTAALAAGVLILGRRGGWDVAALFGVTLAAAVYFAAGQHYAYAAFKFLLIGWWVGAVALVSAVDAVRRRRRVGVLIATLLGTTLVIPVGAMTLMRMRHLQQRLDAPSIAPYRQVLDLIPQMAGRPVIVDIKDTAASLWAVYFLRQQPIRLVEYRGYLAFPQLAALMDRAAQPPIDQIHLLLTDRQSTPDAIGAAGPYTLRELPATGAMWLSSIENPNGAERWEGGPFFWLGPTETEVRVMSTVNGRAELAAQWFRGPSGSPNLPRRLGIRVNDGENHPPLLIAADGWQSFRFAVRAGDNRLYLRSLESPTSVMPKDPRPLMIGMLAPAVTDARMTVETCAAAFTNGWYPRESGPADWWRWSSDGGALTLSSSEDVRLTIRGELLSRTQPNIVVVTSGSTEVARWVIKAPGWVLASFDVQLRAASPVVLTFHGQAAARAQPSDPRRIGIGIRNLTVQPAGIRADCVIR
ncbi:MAG TPA: hypothetical protein VFV98_11740 [Vicinamibacterales bacterium]|nr:hypothetical protein [Vicinamibacterales bacterium]